MQRIGNVGWISAIYLVELFVTFATAAAQPANFPPQLNAEPQIGVLAADPPALPTERSGPSANGLADTPPALPASPGFDAQRSTRAPQASRQLDWGQPNCASGCGGRIGGRSGFVCNGPCRDGESAAPPMYQGGIAVHQFQGARFPPSRANFTVPNGRRGCPGGCPFHGQHTFMPNY